MIAVDVPRRENKHTQWRMQRATEHNVRLNCVMGTRSSWRPLLFHYNWYTRRNGSTLFTWSYWCNNALQLEMWKVCTCYVSQQHIEEHKKSVVQEDIRRAIFWNIEYVFILQNLKKKKTVFSEKTVKICFGGTFDHFWGKEGV